MVSSKWRTLAFIEWLVLWVMFSRMVLNWNSWESILGGTATVLLWEVCVTLTNRLKKRAREPDNEILPISRIRKMSIKP